MLKFYEKNQIVFAVLWIVAYCMIIAPIRGTYGDGSIQMLLGLIVFSLGLTLFVKGNRLENRFGLDRWPENMKKLLYLIPMWILSTGNIWDGFAPSFKGIALVYALLSMFLVGYVEEMIFRGFLFKGMMNEGRTIIAILVSAITFGMGHIVNLFTGQAGFETIIQIIFAISWGFILTMVYYKGGSILPCILAHSIIDMCSVVGKDSLLVDWIYIIATVIVAIIYCIYLSRIHTEKE